jgi:hypothetical protein
MRTVSTFAIAATVCAATAARAAQAPPAKPAPSTGDRRYVVIGCLSRQAPSGGGSTPTYIITDTRGPKPQMYRLDGDASALQTHVGHYMEAAGALSAAAGASANPTMKVSSLVYISKTCPK